MIKSLSNKNEDAPHPPPYNVSGEHKLGVSGDGTLKGSPALLANFIPPTNNLSQSYPTNDPTYIYK